MVLMLMDLIFALNLSLCDIDLSLSLQLDMLQEENDNILEKVSVEFLSLPIL